MHDKSKSEPSQTKHKIERVHLHPEYIQSPNPGFDFALLELSHPIEFRDEVKAIALASAGDSEEKGAFDHGTLFVTSGWGKSHKPWRPVLQIVTVPWVSDRICRKAYGERLTDTMICAGDYRRGGIDSCKGDSGGKEQKTIFMRFVMEPPKRRLFWHFFLKHTEVLSKLEQTLILNSGNSLFRKI